MLVGGQERAAKVDDADAPSLQTSHELDAAATFLAQVGRSGDRGRVDAKAAAEVAGIREVRVLGDIAADGRVVEHLDHVGLDYGRPEAISPYQVHQVTVVLVTFKLANADLAFLP